ncbi:MAG: PilZ domain-containing protein [Gammaproteobacteria bacterium]|nr:PilZ domain-containing protein [Gammaproteobacteria bacterium]
MDNRRRPASPERRIHSRYVLTSSLRLPVQAVAARVEKSCRIVDYSDGGLLIEWLHRTDTQLTLKPGDRVRISLESGAPPERRALSVAASVVRTAYAIAALEFEKADPRALASLRGRVMPHVDREA